MVRQAKQTLIGALGALGLWLALLPASAAAPLPKWKFKVLHTPHFEIIYRVEQIDLAKRYAVAAEQAYELLLPVFKDGPESTIIYISDDTDESNGAASFIPYPMITVYPVLPGTLSSIDDYGDWPLEMIVHEYTHILNMYPAHGFYVPLKYIFGDVIRPNAILPKWYLEGLAVDQESHLTDHGRLRSDETEAMARVDLLGKISAREDIASINEQELLDWPYGNRPYQFGAWWWNQVQTQYGVDTVDVWNQDFARRLPFFLNGPMQDKTQKSASELLKETFATLDARAAGELKTLNQSGPHAGSVLTDEKGEQSVFAVSPSGGKLVYMLGKPGYATEARLKVRQTAGEPWPSVRGKTLFKTAGTTHVRWLNETHILYDRTDYIRPYVDFRDLFIYDIEHGREERLTKDVRAEQPAPSPDGAKVAFIQNDGGRNSLRLLDLKAPRPVRDSQLLVHGNYWQRLSGPEFISAEELVFVMRVRSGLERLYLYNLKTKAVTPWNLSLHSAQNPRLTSKGLLVSDSGTHVRNIYLASAGDTTPVALTNTLTHVETADYDPQRHELIFSELTPEGRRLRTIPYATYKPPDVAMPAMPDPPVVQTTKVHITDDDFQPLSYLAPRFWIPFLYNVENGGWLLQGVTSNSDPTGRNSYFAQGSIDTITKKPSYGLSYTNSSTPTDITGSYFKTVTYLGASNYTLQGQNAALNFGNTWPFDSRYFKWNFGGVWNQTDNAYDYTYHRLGPQVGATYTFDQSANESFIAELWDQEFLGQGQYMQYDRIYAHAALTTPVFGLSKLFIQARAAMAPRLPFQDILDLGDRNVGGNYMVNLVNSDFLLRGYPSGTFVGRKIVNTNLEYSLPLKQLATGYGTFPLFLQSLETVAFFDSMAVDGAGYRTDLGNPVGGVGGNGYYVSTLSHFYSSTGVELRLNTTAAYHLPVVFVLGGYYGLNLHYGGGFSPFFGFALGDLGALQGKTLDVH